MIEFLRPGWLVAFPVGLALLALWWRARAGAGPWRRVVDAELLPHLAERAPRARLLPALAAVLLALACVALAGPSWRAESVPVFRDTGARIVVLDLSPSMNAVDVVPSRLERARAAVVTILRESAGAQLGLVVFAGDAFTVAPLMNDAAALVHLLSSLDTRTVPRPGSRPDLGLEMAQRLLERAGVRAGDVILVGDSAGDERTLKAAASLARAGYPVSVLAVGTPHGGPVRVAGGSFAREENGDVLVARAELPALEQVARAGGGRYFWLPPAGEAPRFARTREAWAAAPESGVETSELRKDDGAWLALLMLPLAALLFRRGWLMAVLVALLLPVPEAYALDWDDLWRRPEQQAAAEFARGRFGNQEALIEKLPASSRWRAAMLYRDGRFAEAARAWGERDTADAHYNRGNALALAGRLEEALEAYGAALERSPAMRDALFNRALVREALAKRRVERGLPPRMTLRDAQTQQQIRREGLQGRRSAPHDGTERQQRGGADPQQPSEGRAMEREPEAAPGGERAGGAEAAEIRRLEALLAEVPDDPGSLLANRFARQLRLRGAWHHDLGARW